MQGRIAEHFVPTAIHGPGTLRDLPAVLKLERTVRGLVLRFGCADKVCRGVETEDFDVGRRGGNLRR